MVCEYKDGLKVNFSGSLQITKGKDVNVFIKEGFMPANIRSGLEGAANHSSCSDLRKIADDVMTTFGKRACIH